MSGMATARTGNMTPWMLRAVDFLADGEWHDRDLLLEDMAKAIPPGQAMRFQENVRKSRRNARLKKGLPVLRATDERVVDRSSWYLVSVGQRGMALKSLHTARRIEMVKREDGKVWVRLRPVQGSASEDLGVPAVRPAE